MRSYRKSFSRGEGRSGLTQEALLERIGAVDSDYPERYSHATVSRWESGGTRPTLLRLKVLGQALNLSQTDEAGLKLEIDMLRRAMRLYRVYEYWSRVDNWWVR